MLWKRSKRPALTDAGFHHWHRPGVGGRNVGQSLVHILD
jgi:hypothetical protein